MEPRGVKIKPRGAKISKKWGVKWARQALYKIERGRGAPLCRPRVVKGARQALKKIDRGHMAHQPAAAYRYVLLMLPISSSGYVRANVPT